MCCFHFSDLKTSQKSKYHSDELFVTGYHQFQCPVCHFGLLYQAIAKKEMTAFGFKGMFLKLESLLLKTGVVFDVIFFLVHTIQLTANSGKFFFSNIFGSLLFSSPMATSFRLDYCSCLASHQFIICIDYSPNLFLRLFSG